MGTLKFELMAKVGTYKDKNGNEKVRWHKMGSCFENEKGLSLKIESMPVNNWDGWVSLFEPKQKDAGGSQKGSGIQDDAIPF